MTFSAELAYTSIPQIKMTIFFCLLFIFMTRWIFLVVYVSYEGCVPFIIHFFV